MKRMALIWMLFCSSCAVFKEKQRVKTDSLFQENLEAQWETDQQLKSSIYQTREGLKVDEVWIHSDAPFKWQIDSGLFGKAGNYQFYLIHKEKDLAKQIQVNEQKATGASEQNKSEVRKRLEKSKAVSTVHLPLTIVGGLIIVVFVWFCWRGRRYLF
ncbi:MAG TPA: hypothetical protein VL125_10020 [Pelobium sp.]|nr:hypothetical protein [Pelobium sp.]